MASANETSRKGTRRGVGARLLGGALVTGSLLSGVNALVQVCRLVLTALHGFW